MHLGLISLKLSNMSVSDLCETHCQQVPEFSCALGFMASFTHIYIVFVRGGQKSIHILEITDIVYLYVYIFYRLLILYVRMFTLTYSVQTLLRV